MLTNEEVIHNIDKAENITIARYGDENDCYKEIFLTLKDDKGIETACSIFFYYSNKEDKTMRVSIYYYNNGFVDIFKRNYEEDVDTRATVEEVKELIKGREIRDGL